MFFFSSFKDLEAVTIMDGCLSKCGENSKRISFMIYILFGFPQFWSGSYRRRRRRRWPFRDDPATGLHQLTLHLGRSQKRK